MKDSPSARKPIVLVIMDGFGLSNNSKGNAISLAKKPNLDKFMEDYPMTTLSASGEEVGLPEGQMGNSEVGHLNIGAGRVVYQSLTLINKEIKVGTFFSNSHYLHAMENAKLKASKLHIFALLSDGGVHSHIKHIQAIIKMAHDQGIRKDQLCVHCFMDGRDVGQKAGAGYIETIEQTLKDCGFQSIASIHGRYYVMDRDKNMDRVDVSYRLLTMRDGNSFNDYHEYLESQYKEAEALGKDGSDEFIYPAYNERVEGTIHDHDSIIFMNFRPDRAIQIATIITNPHFYETPSVKADGSYSHAPYTPPVILNNILFISTMKYADSVRGEIAFKLPILSNTLGEILAIRGYKQLRIAETEKYAHVTFFFDGTINYDGVEKPELNGARRVLVDSPKDVATYDLKPEMSANIVLEKLIEELDKKDLDVVILNFANCDMVGHTAVMSSVIKAVETVDACVGKILDYLDEFGGTLLLTADHGNAESCIAPNGDPMTQHTTSPVPFVINDKNFKMRVGGALCDIAPTILELLGETKPEEMTGQSLLINNSQTAE